MNTSSELINRRDTPDGTKGQTDVSNETETDNETEKLTERATENATQKATEKAKGPLASLMGRRKFLVMGGAGAALAVSGASAAAALIRAGGSDPSPRSANPPGLDPAVNRNNGAVAPPPGGVRYLALAGTDGWATLPTKQFVGGAKGADDIAPYFPDQLADPSNRTTYVFSFRNVTGLNRAQVEAQKGRTQFNAPLFYSTVGEELWVTLSNLGLQLRPDLVDGHTLHWHGFRNAIPFYDGVPESSISVAIGHDFTYVYRPQDAGTYMYHCHFEDVEHVTMGMQGIVFVKPDPADTLGVPTGQQKAYGVRDGDATGETWYHREFAILLGEVDVRAHFNDAHIQATDWTDFHADFHTMNGRSYPDTLEPNGVRDGNGDLHAQLDLKQLDGNGSSQFGPAPDDDPILGRLASNPNSSLVQAAPGERILIRFVNLGFYNRSIVFPGLEVDVLGRDARYVPKSAQRLATDTIQIGPGESRDVFFMAPTTPGDYPFYDRSMDHYPGNADGDDSWVGGARSAVRVISGLGAQLKPNGWAGETEWYGEQPLRPTAHTAPVITGLGAQRIPNGTTSGRYVFGTVTVEQGTRRTSLRWAQSAAQPTPDAGVWTDAAVTFTSATDFSIRVADAGNNGNNNLPYWVRAEDANGLVTIAGPVTI